MNQHLKAGDAVDLHMHTVASDGAWTPEKLTDYLADRNFKVVAVADHDTQRSVARMMELGEDRGMTVIPAVEVTSHWNDRQWHILVYGIDPRRTDDAAKPFQELLADLDRQLIGNAHDAVARLLASGRDLPSLEEIQAGRPLWPYHVLSAGIKDGHFRGLQDAAETVAKLGGSYTGEVPLDRTIAAAHEAGGLTVMAHPGRADAVGIMTEEHLDEILKTMPLDGLEAHYRSHSDEQTAHFRQLAADRGMFVTSGSDSHAPGRPVDPRPWRAENIAPFLERFSITVDPEPEPEPPAAAEVEATVAGPEVG